MKDDLRLYVEKTDNSKFAAAAFDSYDKLINYQVKMIINNKIRYLLPAAMQQRDGRTFMYYDITNKISLKDYAKRERFNKKQFLGILNTLIKIDDEIDEFQLINSGLLFDLDWVFVDSDGSNCEYIYIPNAEKPNDAGEIREFLMEILREGYVDASAQELVISLFTLLQNEDMSVRDIKDLIYRFEDKEKRFKLSGPSENENVSRQENVSRKQDSSQNEYVRKSYAAEKNIPSKPVKPGVKPKTDKKPKFSAEKTGSKEKEEKSTLPLTLTLAGNALALAGIYKIYTFGLLTTEAGLDFTKIGVIALAFAAVDVIVIKELFLGKNKAEKPVKEKKVKAEKPKKEKKAKAKKEKKAGEPKKSPFAKAEKPEVSDKFVPEAEAVPFESAAAKEDDPHSRAAVLPEIKPKAAVLPDMPKAASLPAPGVSERVKKEERPAAEGNDIFEEKTLLMEDGFGIENDETVLMLNDEPLGYVERFEDGDVADKYVIKKNKIIIGRLRSQVDMTVLNPRVGKIHAEITYKDGSFRIKDLSSKNGTYLGEKNEKLKSEESYLLEDGDRFRLADSCFVIHTAK